MTNDQETIQILREIRDELRAIRKQLRPIDLTPKPPTYIVCDSDTSTSIPVNHARLHPQSVNNPDKPKRPNNDW